MWRKRFLAVMAGVVFTVLVAGLSFTAGVYATEYPASSIASRVPFIDQAVNFVVTRPASRAPEDVEAEFAVFWDVWRIVEDDFFGESDQGEMIDGAIEGMINTLDDPYTQYLDPAANAIKQQDDTGKFEGIGATVDMVEGQLTIVSPLKGSPADQAGLKGGDVILRVNETPINGMGLMEAVSLVRGPKGTTVTLTIRREGVAKPFEVSIVREAFELVTVESRMLSDQVGYLTINRFGSRTVEELDENLRQLEEQGARALVLDLRNNPGGFLNSAVETVSRFVEEGPAVWWQNADGSSYAMNVEDRRTFDGRVVVLINQGSASASEIVAGALQDSERALLVGTRSFGKGSVQNVHKLRNGGSVHVTTAHWLTRGKHEINGVGLEPDIHVTQEDDQADVDHQLNVAQRMLQHWVTAPRRVPYR